MNIIKGTVNKVALTLSEKALYSNSEFIIKFENVMNGTYGSRVVAVDDLSTYIQRQRANIFNITESDNEDLSNGILSLNPSGQWNYTVYEMAPSSPRSLDIAKALSIPETGICIVIGSSSESVFADDENKNNVTFDEP